jgi:formaldehyde-activating enzyme
MAKKKNPKKTDKKLLGGRIVLRTGEALVEAEPSWSAAEPEVLIGELDGPVGYALANLMGGQVKGHTRVFAILNSDVQVRPATVMVSKVTVSSEKYTNILMGTVQAAIAHGVLDAVRAGDIPKSKANDLGIIVSVWLDPSVVDVEVDHKILFQTNREATAKAIHKAMHHEPSIDWLLTNQESVPHYFHQLALEGKI